MGRICLLLAARVPVSEKTTEYFAISSFKLHAGLQIRRPAPTYPPVHLRLASRTVCRASLPSSPTYCLNFFFETPGFPLQSVTLLRQQDLEVRFAKRNQLTCGNHKRGCHTAEIKPIHHQ